MIPLGESFETFNVWEETGETYSIIGLFFEL